MATITSYNLVDVASRSSTFVSRSSGSRRNLTSSASSFTGSSISVSIIDSRRQQNNGSLSSVKQHSSLNMRASALTSESKRVLIINTNSGGHAVIGFWLAKQLRTWPRGHEVTILTVGQEKDAKMSKPPFNKFEDLRLEGVKTVWGSPSDISAAVGPSAKFDVVLDNNGKDLDAVKPVIDWAKSAGVKQFLFVSSAGIYKGTDEPPLVEGDAVKSNAGHVIVEEYLSSAFRNAWASFRPQYVTASLQNKDCEEWFFDRIVRGRPVPIPAPGIQLTVIAPAYDMASMIAAAIEQPRAAAGQVFNCVSDRAVTFDGLARMCAKAAGLPVNIVHYDPAKAGVEVKKAFPFRNQHFYSEPRAAKVKLGWKPAHKLQDVLNARFQDYVASGRDKGTKAFEIDDVILSSLGATAKA